jgi:hypothetical protein
MVCSHSSNGRPLLSFFRCPRGSAAWLGVRRIVSLACALSAAPLPQLSAASPQQPASAQQPAPAQTPPMPAFRTEVIVTPERQRGRPRADRHVSQDRMKRVSEPDTMQGILRVRPAGPAFVNSARTASLSGLPTASSQGWFATISSSFAPPPPPLGQSAAAPGDARHCRRHTQIPACVSKQYARRADFLLCIALKHPVR